MRKTFRPRGEPLEARLALAIAAEEQLFVYLVNRARHDPVAYQMETGLPVDLSGVAPSPPLAVNNTLFSTAEFKAEEMAANNYFSHQSAVNGKWPNRLLRDQGYVLPDYFPDNSNQVESLAAGTFYNLPHDPLYGLIYDEGIDPPGHRYHMLSIGAFYADNREIGVGHGFNNAATYRNYWAIHATRTDPADTFLTGVVYADANGNDRYDLNEGLAGVTIGTGALQTTSNAAGGWSLKVAGNAQYTVTASGGAFAGASSTVVNVTSANVEIDFISGETVPWVNFAAPNLPPVAGNDILATNAGLSASVAVLANDTDAEGALNAASLVIMAQAAHGTATVNTSTHEITYTPVAGYSGNDSFTYRVADSLGQFSNVATVNVTVSAVAFPWQNPANRFDVNNLNGTTNTDLFVVLTDLRTNGPRFLPAPGVGNSPPPYLDASGDNKVTNLDLVQVLSELRILALSGEGAGEGEGSESAPAASPQEPELPEVRGLALAAWLAEWAEPPASTPLRKSRR